MKICRRQYVQSGQDERRVTRVTPRLINDTTGALCDITEGSQSCFSFLQTSHEFLIPQQPTDQTHSSAPLLRACATFLCFSSAAQTQVVRCHGNIFHNSPPLRREAGPGNTLRVQTTSARPGNRKFFLFLFFFFARLPPLAAT